jgi:DNA-directed RNA polymerase specialized sigma24 family protein
LGVPVGTVRSRLSRGREQLKRALTEYARGRNLV